MTLRSLAALLLLGGPFSLSASSAADPLKTESELNQWEVRPIIMTYSGGHTDKRKAKKDYGEILYTSSTTQPGIYFSCIEKKFRVGLVSEAQPMSGAFQNMEVNALGGVPVYTSLTFASARFDGQKRIKLGEWLYFEDTEAVLSRKNKPAKMLYNAIIRGQKIETKFKRTKYVTLVLPKISETFADFGAECGIGRLKES